jgi:hypothetical protein
MPRCQGVRARGGVTMSGIHRHSFIDPRSPTHGTKILSNNKNQRPDLTR